MEKAIIVNQVSKKYKLYEGTKERILDLITPRSYGEDFYALADVSFEAKKGEAIGFIGVNGSGKSTLSNIIAGIVPETSGSVQVNGQSALIAVAAGLKGDLTGRDNIELKCLMLGLSKEEIKALEPAIIEFSELEKFIDQPVKSYSSGMRSRLGFAISVNIDPDVIIIDEALSVGDRAFAEKSLNKMQEFKEQQKTMIFVSHSLGQMRQFCEKILWLEYGMVRDIGPVDEVIPKYEQFLNQWKVMSKKERETYRDNVLVHQQNILEGITDGDIPEWNSTMQPPKFDDRYIEALTSRLGHIRAKNTYIYVSPTDTTNRKSSKEYTHRVYYIKKEVTYNKELFYLLSDQPSATKGAIGWMKASEVSSHVDLAIDKDKKLFYIKGGGSSYSKPWGGTRDCIYSELKTFKGHKFVVDETKKIGNNLWYHGILNERQTWIHARYINKL